MVETKSTQSTPSKQALRLVEVLWEDTTSAQSWIEADGREHEMLTPAQCRDVGFHVRETKDNIYIAAGYAMGPEASERSDGWRGLLVIPKGCVKKVNTLRMESLGKAKTSRMPTQKRKPMTARQKKGARR